MAGAEGGAGPAGVAGAAARPLHRPPQRRRGRRAPEAGGDFCACPTRARAGAAVPGLSLAPGRTPAPTRRGREGGAGGARDGDTGLQAKPTRVSWGRAGGSHGWREGHLASPGGEWGRSPVGAGRRVDAASGSPSIPRFGCTDILCPPLSCLFVPSVVAVRPRGFPAAVTARRFPRGSFFFTCSCPSSRGNLFSDLSLPCSSSASLSSFLKPDLSPGAFEIEEDEATQLWSGHPVLPTPRPGTGARLL